jgi:hypothetical protein
VTGSAELRTAQRFSRLDVVVVDDQALEERLVRGFGDFDVALGLAGLGGEPVLFFAQQVNRRPQRKRPCRERRGVFSGFNTERRENPSV